MSLFRVFDISASGMTAERLRMDTIANNLANVNTTRTARGGPYRRQMVVFEERLAQASGYGLRGNGVRVSRIVEDDDPPRLVYDPHHPDANEQGYVEMPNVNIVTEMVDMITASRAYEANVAALNAAKAMALKALDIGR
ncbi:MAG TPA: flagellar basal body rod protein FlgC [Limnochordia bacterium]|nr:flagellar basal body rod protein FlgC [Limnochordia bacterium]